MGAVAQDLYGLPGEFNNDLINATGLNGFSGTISLTLSYSSGVFAGLGTCYCITLGPESPHNSTLLSISASSPGLYTVNVTGSQGALTHMTTVKYHVIPYNADNFGLFTAGSLGIVRGTSQTVNVFISGVNGFAYPTPQTMHFAAGAIPQDLNVSPNSTTFVIQYSSPPTGYGPQLNITAPLSIPLGRYNIFVLATNGTITHLAVITVEVQTDFKISSTSAIEMKQGSSSSSTITLEGLGGYQGTVSLTSKYDTLHLTVSFLPSSVTLSPSTPTANSTIYINAATKMPSGYYNIVVNASDGSIQKTSTIQISVTGLDYAIMTTPSFVTFQEGVFATQTATVSVASLNGFSGAVNITATATSYFKPYQNELAFSPGLINLQLVAGSAQSFDLTVTVRSNATAGPYFIDLTGSARLEGVNIIRYYGLEVTVGPDFTMSSDKTTLTVHQGSAGAVTITFQSVNGFSNGLGLELAPLPVIPPYPSTNFYPSYPILAPGGTNATTLLVEASSDTSLGTYNTTIGANAGYIGHGLPLTIIIAPPIIGPDFNITSNIHSISVAFGFSASVTINVAGLNGFSGSLSLMPLGFEPLAINPRSLFVSPGTGATATLTITVEIRTDLYPEFPAYYQSGTGPILVVAFDSNGDGHVATIRVTASPFEVDAFPVQLSIAQGSSGTSVITVRPVYGWTGAVNLTAFGPTGGPTATLSPSKLNVTDTSIPGTSTLTLLVPSTVENGNYAINITAFYKIPLFWATTPLIYYTILTVTVGTSNGGPGPTSGGNTSTPGGSGSPSGSSILRPETLYGIAGGAIAAGIAGFLVLNLRKRRVRSLD